MEKNVQYVGNLAKIATRRIGVRHLHLVRRTDRGRILNPFVRCDSRRSWTFVMLRRVLFLAVVLHCNNYSFAQTCPTGPSIASFRLTVLPVKGEAALPI